MASPSSSRKGTNIIMKQGQTASIFGNDPGVESKTADGVKELKP